MKGLIVWWSGAIADIPAGWHLCDGTEGTPDLRNKFVVGAGDTYAVNAVGGTATHRHMIGFSAHEHDIDVYPGDYIQEDEAWNEWTSKNAVFAFTSYVSHLPKYYALALIMKLWD